MSYSPQQYRQPPDYLKTQPLQINSYSQYNATLPYNYVDTNFYSDGQWHLFDEAAEVRIAFSIQLHPKMVSIWQMYSPIESRKKVPLWTEQDSLGYTTYAFTTKFINPISRRYEDMRFEYQGGRLLRGTTQNNESLTFYWKPMERAAHYEQGCKFFWNSYCSKLNSGCMYAHMFQDPQKHFSHFAPAFVPQKQTL